MMDNNVQIFSLLDLSSKDHLFMGHIISSLHTYIERENIFLQVNPQIFFFFFFFFFKLGLCVFTFLHLLNFPQNYFFPKLVLFFLFLQEEKLVFNLCCSQRELLLFIGGVASILYRVGFICYLDSLFSLEFCCVCFLFTLYLSCFY